MMDLGSIHTTLASIDIFTKVAHKVVDVYKWSMGGRATVLRGGDGVRTRTQEEAQAYV